MGVYLTGLHFMSVHLIGVYLIYESSLRAGHGWRASLYRQPGWFKSFGLWATRPSGCWSPLERAPRGKKLPKRLPNGLGAAETKAAALHPSGTRAYYLNYLQERWARRGKEAQAIGFA